MSKIRTIGRLQSLLDEELSWRIKEIATLKILVKRSDNIASTTAVRAAIPLLYGHWEGFIKSSATYYLQFINGQSLKYSELTSCFVVFGVKKKLNRTAKLKVDTAIRTEFNLSSKVFVNILKSIGFGTDRYEARFNLIDESLLKRRNYIAHGEYLDVEADGFRDLADEILCMLRWFKTDIENAASLGLFKKIA